jgi:hypothetical protein
VEKIALVDKAAGAVENVAVGKWPGGQEGRWVAALERGGERERTTTIGRGGERRNGMVALEHVRGG